MNVNCVSPASMDSESPAVPSHVSGLIDVNMQRFILRFVPS